MTTPALRTDYVDSTVSATEHAKAHNDVNTTVNAMPYTKNKYLTEPCDVLTNWTVVAGTWAAEAGIFRQTTVGAANQLLRHNPTAPDLTTNSLSAKIRLPSAGQSAGDIYAGLILSNSTSDGGGPSIRVARIAGAWFLEFLADRVAVHASVGYAFALDTYYHLNMIVVGSKYKAKVDGVQVGGTYDFGSFVPTRPHLFSHGGIAEFDDIAGTAVLLNL